MLDFAEELIHIITIINFIKPSKRLWTYGFLKGRDPRVITYFYGRQGPTVLTKY